MGLLINNLIIDVIKFDRDIECKSQLITEKYKFSSVESPGNNRRGYSNIEMKNRLRIV